MKKKEGLEHAVENGRHTVQVSDKAWKILTVLKLMYKKSLGNLIEESAMSLIRSTPFGVAHLKFFLNSKKSNVIITGTSDNKTPVKKLGRVANREKTVKPDVKKVPVKATKKGGVKNVTHAS